MEAPRIPQDLLEYLSSQFPDKCPNLKDTDREIWMAVGARNVINHLIIKFKEQQDNILNIRGN